MIDLADYKAIVKDIGSKCHCPVVTSLNDVKTNGIYLALKYIKRDEILRNRYNNSIVAMFDLSVIGRGANPETMLKILNLEFRLVEELNIMREEEFSITQGIQVNSGSKKLIYAIKDNSDEPEENEEENGNISYKKNYELQILFKR